MKHWTEPNGTFLIKIPMEWQYRNVAIVGELEQSPYSFVPYDGDIGCFQISCYPFEKLAPKLAKQFPNGQPKSCWNRSRMDSPGFDTYVYFGAMRDQALIGKYIHSVEFRGDKRIEKELQLVENVLDSLVVVPQQDRNTAANLDKYDRFLSSLAASYDLLYNAVESESYVEIIIVSANQIDAFLRLSIVIVKQLETASDDIEVKYLFQGETEKGLLERKVFDIALERGVIDKTTHEELVDLYNFRNRIVHRYIISAIKTRDMIPIAGRYLEMHDKIQQVLRSFEDKEIGKDFGIYGHGFVRAEVFGHKEISHAHSMANDKHLLERFKRKIGIDEI